MCRQKTHKFIIIIIIIIIIINLLAQKNDSVKVQQNKASRTARTLT